jgi:hypothetical protein
MQLVSLPKTDMLAFMRFGPTPYSSALSKTARMNAIIQMLQINTVVHTIDACNEEEVYHNSIQPRLEMSGSCFEVQRQAVKGADPAIRPQLLGRALYAVRCNSDLVFRFLLGNISVFIGPEE